MNTTFRRIVPHLWKDAKDPSTYGKVDIDLSQVELMLKKNSIHLLDSTLCSANSHSNTSIFDFARFF